MREALFVDRVGAHIALLVFMIALDLWLLDVDLERSSRFMFRGLITERLALAKILQSFPI